MEIELFLYLSTKSWHNSISYYSGFHNPNYLEMKKILRSWCSCFLLFHLNIFYTKKLSCPTRNICYLFLTFMGIIKLWRSIHLSFQRHQMCTFCVVLGMARNRDGLSCIFSSIHQGCPPCTISHQLTPC